MAAHPATARASTVQLGSSVWVNYHRQKSYCGACPVCPSCAGGSCCPLPTVFKSFRTSPDNSMAAHEDRRLLSEDLFFVRGISILLVVLVHVLGLEGQQGLRGLFQSEASALKVAAEFIDVFNMAAMVICSSLAWRNFRRGDTSARAFF